MADGINIYNPASQLRVSLSSEMTKLLFRREVGPTDSGSAIIGLQGHLTLDAYAFVVNTYSGAIDPKAPHSVKVDRIDDNTAQVSWTYRSDSRLRATSVVMVTSNG